MRVEVIAHGAVLYLNPVIRWNGVALPRPEARLLVGRTWAVRGGAALALAGLAWLVASRLSGAQGSLDRPRARNST